jgi:hypothetical protein
MVFGRMAERESSRAMRPHSLAARPLLPQRAFRCTADALNGKGAAAPRR